jgi:transposase InsO family protein
VTRIASPVVFVNCSTRAAMLTVSPIRVNSSDADPKLPAESLGDEALNQKSDAHGGVSMTGKVVGCAEDGQRAVAEELVDVPTGVDDGGHNNHWNTLFEARVVIGDFKDEHNTRHRHSALGYRTPAEYAAACAHDHYAMACEIN